MKRLMHYTDTVPFTHVVDVDRTRKSYSGALGNTVTRLFGCRHRNLSWPFTHERETYLVCLRCGMRQSFDLKTWKASGSFYHAEISSAKHAITSALLQQYEQQSFLKKKLLETKQDETNPTRIE